MGGWQAVCEVWVDGGMGGFKERVDRWVKGEGKGSVQGPLLMKQKNKGKICFVIYIAGERFFFIHEVFVKQKKENALLITTNL